MQNLILLTGMLLSSYSVTIENDSLVNLPAAQHLNVAYGEDPQQKMDIYLPAGRDTVNTVLLILVHGGSWTRGDKAAFTPYITALQQRLPGYAFANINYRLFNGTQNRFPAQENDLKAAYDFLVSRYAEYGYSKKIVLMGASAGAHLALLQAYKHAPAVRPSAIISFFGPTDLRRLYNHPGLPAVPYLLTGITGTTPQQDPETYKASSPIHFVTAQAPPTHLLHGEADHLVPPDQARLLRDTLKAAGVPHDLVFYAGAGHGWRGKQLEDSFNRIKAFLEKHVTTAVAAKRSRTSAKLQ